MGIAGQAMLPPSYLRSHFDAEAGCNRIVTLVGKGEGALPIPQDLKVSRLVSDCWATHTYAALSNAHGVYTFVLDGELTCEGTTLGRRDSKGIWGIERLTGQTGAMKTDVIFVETVM